MPLFLCRWPNGDCSVVWARNTEDAIVELDQVGNAEGCPIVQLRTFQAHLVLTNHGELALEALGDGTGQHMVSSVYPLLDTALSDAYGDGVYDSYESLPPDRRATIAHAIEKERGRIARDSTQTSAPLTEVGRHIKQQTDAPTVLIDRIVRRHTTKALKKFKAHSKPS